MAGHEPDLSEARAIKEERLSTEKCLQICTQLSDHINQIQQAAAHKIRHDESSDSDTFPERITNEGLQECKDSLVRTALRLEGHHKQLFSRLIEKSRAVAISEEERADLARLQDEWDSTRQGIDICNRAHGHLQDNISTIDNYAIGDAVQFMVSTSQKTIHGRNRGLGWRTRQVGGHISDDTLRHIALSLANIDIPSSRYQGSPPQGDTTTSPDDEIGKKADTKFKQQYGTGFKLTSDTPLDISGPSVGPLEDKANTSPRDSFVKSAQNRGANPQRD